MIDGRGLALRLALIASLFACQTEAFGHARSESYSNWRITGNDMTGTITVSAGEVMSLVELDNTRTLDALFAEHLTNSISISAGNDPCAAGSPQTLDAARGFVRVEIRYACGGRPTGMRYRALLDRLPGHVHYARVFDSDGSVAETLITANADTWSRDSADRHSFVAFLDLGVRHILGGIDHIAFLLGMLLVAGSVGRSIAAVTGFTLGHSVSLAAAVLGYVHAEGRLVEAFIGFTVALVAVEYFQMRRRGAWALPAAAALSAWTVGALALASGLIDNEAGIAYLGFGVFAVCYLLAANRIPRGGGKLSGTVLFTATTAFGLIHGFGFAGFLMETGLGGDSLLAPLFGFNLGVEIGQLGLIGVAFVSVYLLRRTDLRLLAPVAAAGLCGIGVFWFVGRSLTF